MIVPIVLVTLGMATSYLLRWLNARGPTALVVVAHLAGLLMIWTGLIDLVVGAAGLAHGLVEFCELALTDPPAGGDGRGLVVMVGVLALLIGRAVIASVQTVADTRSARARLLRNAAPVVDGVTYAPVGSVACTVGVLRPRIFVDRNLFPRLTEAEQRAVLAHERGHLRGHGLVDLVARSLAAGLAPWPGAALAHREIRLHLEAMADDRAARTTSRRVVGRGHEPQPPAVVEGDAGAVDVEDLHGLVGEAVQHVTDLPDDGAGEVGQGARERGLVSPGRTFELAWSSRSERGDDVSAGSGLAARQRPCEQRATCGASP